MARKILVIGKSGSGKSTSIYNMNPAETAVIKLANKELPVRGGDKKFGAVYVTDPTRDLFNPSSKGDSSQLFKELTNEVKRILTQKPGVKNIIIDDLFYAMSFENFDKMNIKDFSKYTGIAHTMYKLLMFPDMLTKMEDLTFIYMTHTDIDPKTGETIIKSIGRMIDNQLGVEGLFTVVVEALAYVPELDTKHMFKVHNTDGMSVVKTPMGMFEEDYIPNDLNLLINTIKEYYNYDGE